MSKAWTWLGAVVALIAIGAFFWLREPAPQAPAQAPTTPPAAATPPPVAAPAKPAINYPVEPPPGLAELPPLEQANAFVKDRLTQLLGAKAVGAHLQADDFVRRVVATVDNLARALAPPSRWPIYTMPGRFSVATVADGSVIGAANSARYAHFVALVESVDAGRAVALYRQLYPLFQSAYEELGYPGMYFNDRLIAVIDLLLATPEPTDALKVDLPEIKGPLKPTRPWVLYRFADPELESLSSGQKILLRVGRENEKRLKSKLAEVRKLLAPMKASR
jgi:hypothetical protein